MLVKKTFYLVKLHKIQIQIQIHSKGMNFITHFILKSLFRHVKTTHFIPNTKKKKNQILVKVYNILSNYIPITFTYPIPKKAISLHIQRAWITYPFHYNSFEGSKSLISFVPISYPFKGLEFTHFITIHSKGVSHSFHYIPISCPFKGHDYIPIHYIHSLPISYPK